MYVYFRDESMDVFTDCILIRIFKCCNRFSKLLKLVCITCQGGERRYLVAERQTGKQSVYWLSSLNLKYSLTHSLKIHHFKPDVVIHYEHPCYYISFWLFERRNIAYPLRFSKNIPTHVYHSSSGLWSSRYLACRVYVNGTHAKSPNASMNPKPSVVISCYMNVQIIIN